MDAARGVLVVVVMAALIGAPPAAASTVLTVDRTDDDPGATACVAATPDDCSLRGAIINANADALAEVEEIHVPAGTYVLTTDGDTVESGSLNVEYSAKLIGAGSGSTIVDGNATDKVLAVIRGAGAPSERAVDISGVTIRNGDACAGSGGDTNGIGSGGGLLLHGIVTLTDVVVEDNQTCGSGGGIFAASGTHLTIAGGAIRGNTSTGSGGGLLSEGATTITDTTIAANTATTGHGGGIRALGTLVVDGSTISGNTANCCAGGLHGGHWSVATTITLTNTTVSGNIATWHNTGTPQYFPGVGGGMSVEYATTTLNHVTVAANTAQTNPHTGTPGQAGGIRVYAGSFTANNSIVHGNLGQQDCLADGGAVTGGTTNLVGADSCALPGTDGADPLLGGLMDNGGPTETHALPETGSPAVDAANGTACKAVDQRGVARPYGTACDIGAYEYSTQPVPADYTVTSCTDPALATLTAVTGDLIIDVEEECALSLPALESVAGEMDLTAAATLTSLAMPELSTIGGAMDLGCAPTLTSLSVPQLATVGGDMTVTETSLTTLNAPTITTVGGGMTMSGNPTLTTIEAPALEVVGGSMTMTGEPAAPTGCSELSPGSGPMALVSLPSLTTVGGDVALETLQADLDLSEMQVAGDISLTGTGDVAAQTAGGATDVALSRAGASVSVLLPAGTFASHVGFDIETLSSSALDAQDGTDANGGAAVVDPVSAYRFLFDVPSLEQSAELAFELDLAALPADQRTLVLDAVQAGQLAVAVKGDSVDSAYQAFAICGEGETPGTHECVALSLLDAGRQPVVEGEDPAFVRLEGVAGHFSTWTVAVVAPLPPLGVVVSGPATRGEGRAFALSAAISGATGNATVEWTATPDGPVDAGATCVFSAPTGSATSLTCTDNGMWEVSAQVTDGARSAGDTSTVTVSNGPPVVSITSPGDYAQRALSNAVSISAAIDDPGANDTHTCSINWGDGTTTSGVVSNDTCTGSHRFGSVGVRIVTVKVTDDDGAAGSAQVTVVSVNSRSVVTGGGLVRPDGERHSFGLVALRKDGKWRGQMIVQGPSGNRFRTSVVRSLVVDEPRATWNGTGRWGKKTGCTYTIKVVDGRLVSSTAPDRLTLTVRGPGGAVLLDIERAVLRSGRITVYPGRL